MGDQVPLTVADIEERIFAAHLKALRFYTDELGRLRVLRDAVKAFVEAMGDGDELQIAEFNAMVDALHRLEQQ